MKSNQIYIGNIKKCIQYEEHIILKDRMYIGNQCISCESFKSIIMDDELYKENAILLKIGNDGYIDLDRLNSFLDYIKLYRDIKKMIIV